MLLPSITEFRPAKLSRPFTRLMRLVNRYYAMPRAHLSCEVRHIEKLRGLPPGVIITPNHSDFADSMIVTELMRRAGRFTTFMANRLTFDALHGLNGVIMQWMGGFSVNRGGENARCQQFAKDVVKEGRYDLLIFPEGEIYLLNDLVMPFKPGVAMLALEVARENRQAGGIERPIYIVPVAIKYRYLENVLPALDRLASGLEIALFGERRSEGHRLSNLLAEPRPEPGREVLSSLTPDAASSSDQTRGGRAATGGTMTQPRGTDADSNASRTQPNDDDGGGAQTRDPGGDPREAWSDHAGGMLGTLTAAPSDPPRGGLSTAALAATTRLSGIYDRIVAIGVELLNRAEREWSLHPDPGWDVYDRVHHVQQSLLESLERRHLGRVRDEFPFDRAQRMILHLLEELAAACGRSDISDGERETLVADLRSDLKRAQAAARSVAFADDYLAAHPTPERLAETLTKLEREVRGRVGSLGRIRRSAMITLGDCIDVRAYLPGYEGRGTRKETILGLTHELQTRIETMIDAANAEIGSAAQSVSAG